MSNIKSLMNLYSDSECKINYNEVYFKLINEKLYYYFTTVNLFSTIDYLTLIKRQALVHNFRSY